MSVEYEEAKIKSRCSKCGLDLPDDESVVCSSCGTVRVSTAVFNAKLDERAHLMIDRVP